MKGGGSILTQMTFLPPTALVSSVRFHTTRAMRDVVITLALSTKTSVIVAAVLGLEGTPD